MLIAVKLLFAMIDHHAPVDQRTDVPDDQWTADTFRDVHQTVRGTGRDDAASSGTVPNGQTMDRPRPAILPADRPAAGGAPGVPGQRTASGAVDPGHRAAEPSDIRTVAHLIPAARAARATLARDGLSLSRDHLADAMREDEWGVSNERASLMLKILKAERDVPTIGAATVRASPHVLGSLSEADVASR